MRVFSTAIHLCAAVFIAAVIGKCSTPAQDPQLRIESGMHIAPIVGAVTTADGMLLLTGSTDKSVRLWSLQDGKLIKTFAIPSEQGYDGRIDDVSISPDGQKIAVSSFGDGGRIYILDTASGAVTKSLGSFVSGPRIAFSPDGRYLAAGFIDKKGLQVWTTDFAGPPVVDADYSIINLAYDGSGSGRLATVAYDNQVRLYERDLTKPPRILKIPGDGDAARPVRLAFSPDGALLAFTYEKSNRISVIDVAQMQLKGQFDTALLKNGGVFDIEFSADGKNLFAAGSIMTTKQRYPLIRWDVAGLGKPVVLEGGAEEAVTGLVATATGGIAFVSAAGEIGLYGPDARIVFNKSSVRADMRMKTVNNFAVAQDGTGVWFGLKLGAKDPWRFDVEKLAFNAMPARPSDYILPITDTLDIKNWTQSQQPTLNGKPVEVFAGSRSLSIAPDARSFAIGTDLYLFRLDEAGKRLWMTSGGCTVWGVNHSADGSLIITANDDGTIRWHRASDGVELLALFVHVPDKRWIAWTPSGYYAASPGGEDLIGWHINGKSWNDTPSFFPASLLREKFYRPDIVQLVLKTKDVAAAVIQANEAARRKEEETKLPAVVEIVSDPRGIETDRPELELTYRLHSPSGRAVTRLEMRIDGQLTQTRAMQEVNEELELERDNRMSLLLPPRDAVVSLTAFIGDQPSAAASVPVKWTGAKLSGDKPKLYALLVGVSAYREPSLRLNYAAKDAIDVEAALRAQKGKFFGDVETVLLLDDKADEDDIEIELTRLSKKVGPNDYAFVFMAGHGVTDRRGSFHFLPANASLAEDELAAKSLSGLVIRDNLRTIQGKVLFFMDACNAGSGIAGGQALADMTGFANEFAQANGVVMYASSTGRQFSYEKAEWGNGAFTKALLATLEDKEAFGGDGRLSIFELAESLGTRVETMTEGLQTPVMTKSAAIPNFYLASMQ